MKKLFIATLIAIAAIPAFAWGDREQGALLGLIIGGMLVQQPQPQPVYVAPQPVYVAPPVYVVPPYTPPPVVQYEYRPVCGVDVVCQPVRPQRYCRSEAVFNHHGRFVGYRTICE